MVLSKLQPGDCIGLAAPSHVADPERYGRIIRAIERLGFRVKTGENFYKSSYGYLASEAERAADFNQLARDAEVKMVFFGGGSGAAELLPLLDYDAIRQNPKIYSSYSDGTFLLNAIHAKTGFTTYYGQTPGSLEEGNPYDDAQFAAHFVQGGVTQLASNSEWQALCGGNGEGSLIGGYLGVVALLLNTAHFKLNPQQKYVLFLEDHEKFSGVASVSAQLSFLGQQAPMHCIAGLLFGHYSENPSPDFLAMLQRFGEKHRIPVVYCDDFGHGANHAILPIGARAILDADAKTLYFLESK